MPQTDDYVFFYSSKRNKEPDSFVFSNFHKAPTYDSVSGRIYNCAEQMYQMEKLRTAQNYGCTERSAGLKRVKYPNMSIDMRMHEIMATGSALKQAHLARDIELNAPAEVAWNQKKSQVLYQVSKLKYTQNPDERDWLLSTGDKMLVEASPKDRVCGIGYNAANAEANVHQWGQNQLGHALMSIRTELRQMLVANPQLFDLQRTNPKQHRLSARRRVAHYQAELNGETLDLPQTSRKRKRTVQDDLVKASDGAISSFKLQATDTTRTQKMQPNEAASVTSGRPQMMHCIDAESTEDATLAKGLFADFPTAESVEGREKEKSRPSKEETASEGSKRRFLALMRSRGHVIQEWTLDNEDVQASIERVQAMMKSRGCVFLPWTLDDL